MTKVNKLFEQRCNESRFSWDGKYANEDDINEDDAEDYNREYNVAATVDKNDPNYTDPYDIKEKSAMFLGNDMETIEEKSDKIKGGLADTKSAEDIAKKHDVSIDIINNAIAKGVKVELEHTSDKGIAYEIAKDHVFENPKYYEALVKMENGLDEVETTDVEASQWFSDVDAERVTDRNLDD
tara:strand:+ start:26010 stop:26555 length:546 start_codon:yes stop_codon:yes gene_type:complete